MKIKHFYFFHNAKSKELILDTQLATRRMEMRCSRVYMEIEMHMYVDDDDEESERENNI